MGILVHFKESVHIYLSVSVKNMTDPEKKYLVSPPLA